MVVNRIDTVLSSVALTFGMSRYPIKTTLIYLLLSQNYVGQCRLNGLF